MHPECRMRNEESNLFRASKNESDALFSFSHIAWMEKPCRILFAGLVLFVAGGIIWFVLAPYEPPEPVYQGRSLSYWLDRYDSSSRTEAEEAVLKIGTNAIPTLLRKLQAKDSGLKRKLVALAEKQDFINFNFKTAEDEYNPAVEGFRILGDQAKDAVPALITMYDQSPPPDLRERIAMALGNIGPSAKSAIPSLLRGVTNTDDRVRESAISALCWIHSESDLVVRALTKALSDPAQGVQLEAAKGLVSFGANVKAAIPVLLDLAADRDETVRSEVMWVLRRTHEEPQVVVPVLVNALSDSSVFVRARAAQALGAFGTNAIPAVPLLLELAAETNETVRDLAVVALGEIHSEPQLVVPMLTGVLSDPKDWIRANAAEGLGNFGTNAIPAIPALLELYFSEQNRPPRTRTDMPDTIGMVRESLKKIDPETATKAGIK